MNAQIKFFLNIFLLFFSISFLTLSCKKNPKTKNPNTEEVKTFHSEKPTNTITVRLRAEPDRLSPILTIKGWSLQICDIMFPTLLNWSPQDLSLKPSLAKSLPIVTKIKEGEFEGNQAFTFEIQEEAVWDNGTPVTGNDYLFTLKAVFNPHVKAGPYRGVLEFIRDIKVDPNNPKKFTVITGKQYIKAKEYSGFYVYPEYAYDPEGIMKKFDLKDLTNPSELKKLVANSNEKLLAFANQFNDTKYSREKSFISTCGAYALEEWVTGDRIVLKKKKNWWGDKAKIKNELLTAYPEKLIFKILPDDVTALTLLKNEEIDIMSRIPVSHYEALKNNSNFTKNYNLSNPLVLGYNYFGFNTKNPKLKDKKVRRAIAHLIDINQVIKTVKHGLAKQIVSPVLPSASFYNKSLKNIDYNPQLAKQLLTEAGWKDSNNNGIVDKMIDGELVDLNVAIMITPKNQTSNDIALIFKNNAKKGGVGIEIVTKEARVLRENLKKRNFEIFAAGTGGEPGLWDPKQFWHTESDNPNGYNRTGFGDAKTDAIIDEIRSTDDEVKRTALSLELQEIIYEEQSVLFLYTTLDCIAIHKRFSNVNTSSKYPGYFPNYFK